jgi:hypothetical protein
MEFQFLPDAGIKLKLQAAKADAINLTRDRFLRIARAGAQHRSAVFDSPARL